MVSRNKILSSEQLGLVVKAARMYHEQKLSQAEIAERLHVSQSRVSRWLSDAIRQGIVRTIVIAPPGTESDLEEAVAAKFDLQTVVIADPGTDDEASVIRALGTAAAGYLEVTLTGANRVGLSSWSSTLLATVDAMAPRNTQSAEIVVQVIGGVGNPTAQVRATHLADRLASVTKTTPRFLPAPGIVSSQEGRDALLADPFVAEVAAEWDRLDTLLVGIGSIEPSPLLRDSGNSLGEADLSNLARAGAVGDVCLRFFDERGVLIQSDLNDRVLGISPEQILSIDRRIGVAGGSRKYTAIKAAVEGNWVNVLITDKKTALKLESEKAPTRRFTEEHHEQRTVFLP
ncbi:sugar-binding transcriptional regulator [Arthrobacter crusticola]|uniref:sugar-binding transcriptional regulator n=1 Tax=Arthrobacter crusticola TaxID=2547960 RepID=UPI001404632F|nr:sugar-binding transcriptional regulator [Arthrobacter crusticola]